VQEQNSDGIVAGVKQAVKEKLLDLLKSTLGEDLDKYRQEGGILGSIINTALDSELNVENIENQLS